LYEEPGICNKDIISSQFKTKIKYKNFAQSSLESILDRKEMLAELENDYLEAKLPSR
jgi:hypothetical protein